MMTTIDEVLEQNQKLNERCFDLSTKLMQSNRKLRECQKQLELLSESKQVDASNRVSRDQEENLKALVVAEKSKCDQAFETGNINRDLQKLTKIETKLSETVDTIEECLKLSGENFKNLSLGSNVEICSKKQFNLKESEGFIQKLREECQQKDSVIQEMQNKIDYLNFTAFNWYQSFVQINKQNSDLAENQWKLENHARQLENYWRATIQELNTKNRILERSLDSANKRLRNMTEKLDETPE